MITEIGIKKIIKETEYIQSESGLIFPSFYVKKQNRPSHFDFFAGAGGFGLGMVQAGYETIGANEYAPEAAITYMVNLGHYPMNIYYIDGESDKKRLDEAVAKTYGIKKYKHEVGITEENMRQFFDKQDYEYELNKKAGSKYLRQFYGTENIKLHKHCAGSGWIRSRPDIDGCKNFWFGDICKLSGKEILDTLGMKQGDIDAVTGGPPCQGFSKAGKQDINDPRNQLIYEYARMIVELQPKTFILENVPDLATFLDCDGIPVLNKFCLMISEGGYGKWERLKKSLLMQTGVGACIKPSTSVDKNNSKTKRRKNGKNKK